MAYFIPSYFQKRLLRYALLRLDFIETNALDLENLDITFGQRSVIELKNVGIKVSKIIEVLHLPPSLVLNHASIRNLRLTIPADLHASGIVVEVGGINIQANLEETKPQEQDTNTRSNRRTPPSRDDVANRPRIPSSTVHDPGGKSRTTGRTKPDVRHIVPTSQDLAMSFLETEPLREKKELQAVFQSQAVLLQHSNASLDGSVDETGLGMPGGFSLPGFVANFFSGVADRLSVKIRNIKVTIGMQLSGNSTLPEIVKICIKVEEVCLESIDRDMDSPIGEAGRRNITLTGFEVRLLSEAEAFSQHSATSSPRLAKSRSKMSSISSESQASQPLGRMPSSDSPRRSIHRFESSSSGSVTSSDPARSGLGIMDSVLDSSQIFYQPTMSPYQSMEKSMNRPPIDNRLHAEELTASRDIAWPASQSQASHDSFNAELTESKLFTHDEAESMYMSAVSTGFENQDVMPGGWESPEDRVFRLPEPTVTSTPSPSNTGEFAHQTKAAPPGASTEPPMQDFRTSKPNHNFEASKSLPMGSSEPDFVSKRLLFIDKVKVSLPTPTDDEAIQDNSTSPELSTFKYKLQNSRLSPHTPMMDHRKPMAASQSQFAFTQSTYGRISAATVIPEDEKPLCIDIGDASLSLDISICYILVKSASTVARLLPASENRQNVSQISSSKVFAKSRINSITCNIYQIVSEISQTDSPLLSSGHGIASSQQDSPLLSLSLSKIRHEVAITTESRIQSLAVHKIVLGRSSEQIMSFFDPSNIQESFAATSMILEPDDLVLKNSNDRIDISVKPVHIVLDLLLMDDVLSRSGGLSSLLDLGSSIATTGTIKEPHQKPKHETRQRSVRFDSHDARSRSDSDPGGSGKKINVRISGAILDLVGSESSVRVKSSPVKIVLRGDRFALQISTVSIQGPVLANAPSSSDISIKLTDVNLRYLNTPEEQDLDRLLSLLTPSNDKYDQEDDIMVDTLIRQRRKGGVVRFSSQNFQINANGLKWQKHLLRLGDELSKLSSVTKYLPEDDRPGILIFGLINTLNVRLDIDRNFGPLTLKSQLVEGAHISLPALMAAQASSFSLTRGENKKLIGEVIPEMQDKTVMGPPMLMCRFIADEMEPTVKLKLSNTCLEYDVPTVVALTELIKTLDMENNQEMPPLSPRASDISSNDNETSDLARKVRLSLAMRNSAMGLTPLSSPAKGLFLLTDATLSYNNKHHGSVATLDLRKASILVIDDVSKTGNETGNIDHKLYFDQNDQVQELTRIGFVPVGSISAALVEVKITEDYKTQQQFLDVEFRNNLFFLETCADSTQTLFQILNGLTPPTPPSTAVKYRTQIVPIQDMLASFTGNPFVSEVGPELGMQTSQVSTATVTSTGDTVASVRDEDGDGDNTFLKDLFASRTEEEHHDTMADSYIDSELAQSFIEDSVHVAPVNLTANDESDLEQSIVAHSMLDFRTDHFVQKTSVGGTAHRWDSSRNTYGMGSETSVSRSPLKIRIRDVHIIWNLFDGYDWQSTRDTISQAVQDIETKAMTRQVRRDSRRSPAMEEDEESVIGDVLFNSIYISIPAHRDPKELANAINQDIGDMASETGSYATSTTITAAISRRQSGIRPRHKRLRLNRSKQHKMTFELAGVSADFLMFPPNSGEVESSLDVRVRKLEVFDHVPTSTWKKFATYMQEAGEREVGTDMVHIELLNVKPVADLSASEMVLKITVLPLRLHVDQDALDFLTRFFEFKDDRIPPSTTPSTPPFLQRVEVNPIRLRLDFKPKRVDYAGLRSGRTTEFMNFFILDRADMVLRRVILYGVSGLERLGLMLNSIWTPDVKNNQLPGVLAGLAPIRSLVDVGSGVKDLIAIPVQEYKKDGRIVRSIQKGALAFAKTTTTELVNLGAKLAIGTQTVLQNTEEMLTPSNQHDDLDDDEGKKQISLYADQPLGIVQGLRGAYVSLERDLLLAKDAIVAVPGEIMATGSASGAAKVVLMQSPTIILRPAIGVTKAVGQALLGAGNTLDKSNRKRIEDKYKRY